jgi:hypothetical protein
MTVFVDAAGRRANYGCLAGTSQLTTASVSADAIRDISQVTI